QGQGSEFYFTARFGRCACAQLSETLNQSANLANLPVLVVDDNATNRQILFEQLQHWRMKPAVADSARHALEMLRAGLETGHPYRVALLDMMMPETDGLMLAQQIREDRQLASLRLLILSSADTSPG